MVVNGTISLDVLIGDVVLSLFFIFVFYSVFCLGILGYF